MKNLAASREVSNPNPVKSFAASGGEFDPKGLKPVTWSLALHSFQDLQFLWNAYGYDAS